ncbi:MAG: hypothetical protein ACKOW5_12040 [Actinomycetales bacterium]
MRIRLGMSVGLIATCLTLVITVGAPAMADQEPPVAQAKLVQQTLLTAPAARSAVGFTGRLFDDDIAGRTCFAAATTWTCDAWFTTSQYTQAYPNGVSITVSPDEAAATRELARLAALEPDASRPGSRVLRADAGTLIVLTTGFAVGMDLLPAVTVSVTTVQGRYLVMGTCQVQRQQLILRKLRSCATKLQTAQAARAQALSF